MKNEDKVLIAVDIENDPEKALASLRDLNMLANNEIHLVHVFPLTIYGKAFQSEPIIKPTEGERPEIRQRVLAFLEKTAKSILPQNSMKRVYYHCFFSSNPKKKFSEYAIQNKVDLIIVATKEKHGFFDSSFAQYIGKNTSCPLLTVKYQGPSEEVEKSS